MYANPQIRHLRDPSSTFRVHCELEDLIDYKDHARQNGTCWQHLFQNPTIVKGYPIRARSYNERGLELPLKMMAMLGKHQSGKDF